MSFIPGIGLVRGMGLTLRRFFAPKATIRWPEEKADVAPKFRGRLQLLYDEYGTLKCETCFQCAQASPSECIDMGGMDTKGRFHVHWGAAETYGERREESAPGGSWARVPRSAQLLMLFGRGGLSASPRQTGRPQDPKGLRRPLGSWLQRRPAASG